MNDGPVPPLRRWKLIELNHVFGCTVAHCDPNASYLAAEPTGSILFPPGDCRPSPPHCSFRCRDLKVQLELARRTTAVQVADNRAVTDLLDHLEFADSRKRLAEGA